MRAISDVGVKGVYSRCAPETQSLEAVIIEDTRLQNSKIFIPCLGLNKIGAAASYLTQLDPRLCIQNGCSYSLSRLSIGDSVPLGWGGGNTGASMQARRRQSSLLNSLPNSGPQCPQWPQKEVPRL